MTVNEAYFDQLFTDSDDPWSFRTRWYEHRKRALIMATLPRQRYDRIFEPACANGELSGLLAQRARHLLCQDVNAKAVSLARERLNEFPHARVEQATLPRDWPPGAFDLIVLGEIGYYLSTDQWDAVIDQTRASLTPEGGVLACHWLHPIDGCPQTGGAVHRRLHQRLGMTRLVVHQEQDFLLEYWTAAPFHFDLTETYPASGPRG
ncbi:nodulation S family protein [Pseudomonas sp. GD03842]|uniref:class I SAM-dependent methyltransferase n=1 Tax=Pseudomonas sp. GD03842 TaxID=2975385 RepID=UPI00244D1756|nr:SAM-dependent methyltransferase [Pseudomonas sp. GD03842]MDH0748836.1 nodulation S family protein [Pseudomonas sp. GD03842]